MVGVGGALYSAFSTWDAYLPIPEPLAQLAPHCLRISAANDG